MPEFVWNHSRRFNAYANYFSKKFGERVQKLSVNAGFTCPNRDGRVAFGACKYCNNSAFNPSYCSPKKSVSQQIQEGIEFHKNRYRRANKYLAYFQAYSNTYAKLDKLQRIYNEALNQDGIIGLVIGTRPDCVDDEILDYFSELSKSYYIIIEFGVESCYDKSLNYLNRGHTFEQSKNAILQTAERGINVGAHMIFGLPGETDEMILDEARIISELPLTTVKFHQLQILKETAFEKEYLKNPKNFPFKSLENYIDFVVKFVERLNPEIVIERIAGEVPPRFLVSKSWGLIRNDQILQKFERKLEELDTWQGKLFKPA